MIQDRDSRPQYEAILKSLEKTNPRMISEVQTFISEIEKIIILWEEEWLNTLLKLQSDITKFFFFLFIVVIEYLNSFFFEKLIFFFQMNRKIQRLQEEANRITHSESLSKNEKAKLISENYKAIMKSDFIGLDKLYGMILNILLFLCVIYLFCFLKKKKK